VSIDEAILQFRRQGRKIHQQARRDCSERQFLRIGGVDPRKDLPRRVLRDKRSSSRPGWPPELERYDATEFRPDLGEKDIPFEGVRPGGPYRRGYRALVIRNHFGSGIRADGRSLTFGLPLQFGVLLERFPKFPEYARSLADFYFLARCGGVTGKQQKSNQQKRRSCSGDRFHSDSLSGV